MGELWAAKFSGKTGSGADTLDQSLVAMGAPTEIVMQARERSEDDFLGVYSENWDAVNLFLKVQTQWNRAGLAGVITGLNYDAVYRCMQIYGLERDVNLFEKLQVIELAVLTELNRGN